MKKKILSLALVMLSALLLVSCKDNKSQGLLEEASKALAVPATAVANFDLPTKAGEASVSWASSNADLLKVGTAKDDKVTIEVTNPEENTDVVLTATLKIKKASLDKKFTVEVQTVDTEAPVIKGVKESYKYDFGALEPNWLAGVSASDNVDETVAVTVDKSAVKLDTLGQYPIIFKAVDASGNVAEVAATVVVGDYSAPVITGYVLHRLNVGATAPNWLAEVTAKDNYDATSTVTVKADDVNLNEAGVYTVVYRSEDAAGNLGTVRVRVIVESEAEGALAKLTLPGKASTNLTLPVDGGNGVTISWASSNAAVLSTAGVVNRAVKNTAVKLTATAAKGGVEATREFWVTVYGSEVDLDASYLSAFSEIQTLNPLMSTGVADSDVWDNLVAPLYGGDYDWEKAMEEGYADFPGDFSKIKSDRNPNGTVDMPSIAYKQVLGMAAAYPYAVTVGTDNAVPGSYGQVLDNDAAKETLDDTWIIQLRSGLVFEDNTPITADTYEYAFKQYLNGSLANERANYLYDQDYVPLLNGKNYFDGKVTWDKVGYRKINDLTFEITLSTQTTQYDLMSYISIINLVHVTSFANGFNSTGTENNYGSKANPLVSYGPFTLANNYDATNKFEFTRNDKYYKVWDIPFKNIGGPILKDQEQIINEFKLGKLDVAGVGGAFWDEFQNDDNLYVSPSNSFYRLAISLERPEGKAKPILQYEEFRKALYLATDRQDFADNVQPPSQGALGYLSNIHQVSEWASQAYASSTQSKQQLEDLGLSPETGGFNSAQALALFKSARTKAIAAGHYAEGETIKIEFLYYDAGSNTRIANWVKKQFEEVFNETPGQKDFEVVLNAVSSDELSKQRNAGDFDLVFTGMSGATFQATFGMGYIFSPTFSTFLVGKGHDIPNKEVTAEMTNLFALVADKDEYDADAVKDNDGKLPEGMRTKSEQEFFEAVEDTEGEFTGTFDELFLLWNATPEFGVDYDGQEEDLTNITAALERALLEQMIAVPLFSSTSAAVYSTKVVRLAHAYHLFLGWGGMSYMYKTK